MDIEEIISNFKHTQVTAIFIPIVCNSKPSHPWYLKLSHFVSCERFSPLFQKTQYSCYIWHRERVWYDLSQWMRSVLYSFSCCFVRYEILSPSTMSDFTGFVAWSEEQRLQKANTQSRKTEKTGDISLTILLPWTVRTDIFLLEFTRR